jgi:hypothetical protein
MEAGRDHVDRFLVLVLRDGLGEFFVSGWLSELPDDCGVHSVFLRN